MSEPGDKLGLLLERIKGFDPRDRSLVLAALRERDDAWRDHFRARVLLLGIAGPIAGALIAWLWGAA